MVSGNCCVVSFLDITRYSNLTERYNTWIRVISAFVEDIRAYKPTGSNGSTQT